jgi:indolepyruvate ferredoxin oxidoreductase
MPESVEEARQACRPEAARERATDQIELADVDRRRVEALGLNDADQISVERFACELALWGGDSVLRRYLDVLDRVASVERRTQADGRRVTLAVARNLYKLMAYKDEYEVARLMNDPDGNAAAAEAAAAGDRVAWKLHPPLLRTLGLTRKITIGSWARPAIRLLAKAKILRGTPFDPFGYARVRRLERALPGEYVAAIDRVLPQLRADNLEAIVALAELPDLVRGYEDLKVDRIAEYRAKLDRELSRVSDS